MTLANLCSLERARLNLPSSTSSDDRTINAMIAAVSAAIRKHCRRDFALSRYDEILDGQDGPRLLLREYPLASVESVRCSPQVVLDVTNTLTSTNQQARVTVTSAGLELVRVASGTRVVDTSVTWASNATMQAVASAVVALGVGWSARAAAGFELFPAADLFIAPSFGDAGQSQGALDCRGRYAGLTLHAEELAGYCWDARGWLYRRDPRADAFGWPGEGCGWSGGPGYWRIQYTAGDAEVPQAVQEACAQWTAELFQLTKRDPAAITVSLVGSVGQNFVHNTMPARVQGLLAPYRRHVV